MYDDPLTALERELLVAARRQAAGARGMPRRWRPSIGGTVASAAAVAAAAIAVGAVLLLGARNGRREASGAPTATASHVIVGSSTFNGGALRIAAHFHVLNRGFGESPAQSREVQSAEAQLHLSPRYSSFGWTGGAVEAPGDARIVLLELVPLRHSRPQGDVMAALFNGFVIDSAQARTAVRRGLTVLYGNSSSIVRLAVIVPNEVRSVSIDSPRVTPNRAAVHDNLASFRIASLGPIGPTIASRMTWFGPNGRVLARVKR